MKANRLNSVKAKTGCDREPGTGVHAYFPVIGKAAANEQELGPDSIMLVEGEFKCLSLVEAGIPAIGLPSFNVYTNDENGEPRLLDNLILLIEA
jgi:hypothetical protein